MAKKSYIGINNRAQQIKKAYIGVNGVARKVKKAYIGINGVAHQFYSASTAPYNHLLVLGDNGYTNAIFGSHDGYEWEEVSKFQSAFKGVIWGDRHYVTTKIYASTFMQSEDGESWTIGTARPLEYVDNMIYDGSRYICNWKEPSTSNTVFINNSALSAITYLPSINYPTSLCHANSKTLIGSDEADSTGQFPVYVLPDGQTTYSATNHCPMPIRDMVWTGSRYISVAPWYDIGFASYSANGTTWTEMNGGSRMYANKCAYGDGVVVAVGYGGTSTNAKYCRDGTLAWSDCSGLPLVQIMNVSYDGEKFLAITVDGRIYVSFGGMSWTHMQTINLSALGISSLWGAQFANSDWL